MRRVRISFGWLAMMLLMGCATNHHLTRKGVYKQLPPAEYAQLLQQKNVNIIDVRTASEYRKSRLAGAVNASFLSGSFSKRVKSYHLDTTKLTLIYCETQHRSPMAANKLYKMGFKKIVDLDRGMRVYRKEGLPFQK